MSPADGLTGLPCPGGLSAGPAGPGMRLAACVSAETPGDTPSQIRTAGSPACQHQREPGEEIADDPDVPDDRNGRILPRLRLGPAVRAAPPGGRRLPGFTRWTVPRMVLHGVRHRAADRRGRCGRCSKPGARTP